MKTTEVGIQLPGFLPKLSHDKQVLALKLIILSIAVILCEHINVIIATRQFDCPGSLTASLQGRERRGDQVSKKQAVVLGCNLAIASSLLKIDH